MHSASKHDLCERSLIKIQTRDLSRVRQNQQRSRERKRAYVAELEANIARLLAQDTSDQTVRDENNARRDFLRDLGIADSAQERYIQTYVARLTPRAAPWPNVSSGTLTPSVGTTNKPGKNTDPPSFIPCPPQEALVSSTRVCTPVVESIAMESLPKTASRPAQSEGEGLFEDPRSLGLLEPLPSFHAVDFDSKNLNLTFDDYGTDGTTACPIAFRLILQNNARGYSIARLESKLLAGYRTAGNEGDSCRIINKVLFAVLAEIS